MASGAEGQQGAGGSSDFILDHIIDHPELHLGPLHIHLPKGFEVFGIYMPITQHLVMMWVAALFLILVLWASTRRRGLVPSGFGNVVEALVLFVRDELAIPNIGKKEAGRFMPFLLTLFFFILTCNLMGLIPFGATPTGNISVTAGLAIFSFVVIQLAGMMYNGVFGYWKGLIPHGVPFWLVPLLFPIEVAGLIIKPFALCVRLFANMTAGHIVILSLIGLIFILHSVMIAPASILFAVAIYMLEIFVALVQAYIFTLLSSVFIGMAVHQDH